MLAEEYINRLHAPDPTRICHRYWVHPQILVGGSILDATDFHHLERSYKIAAVVNVEAEHDDAGKEISSLIETQVPDDDQSVPVSKSLAALTFAQKFLLTKNRKIYVHSQMGAFRAPAFAYLFLRGVFNMGTIDAITVIRAIRSSFAEPGWGELPRHKIYLASMEDALGKRAG